MTEYKPTAVSRWPYFAFKFGATSGATGTTVTPPCVAKRGCHTGPSVKPCDYDYTCPPPKECCAQGCCFRRSSHTPHPALPSSPASSQIPPVPVPVPMPPHGPHGPHTTNLFSVVFWNHWYFWSLLALLLLSCSGGCSLWRRRREPAATRGAAAGVRRCHGLAGWPAAMLGCAPADSTDPVSEPDSIGSCYPPPQYSRCSSFAQPPPYSEVTSKPDLYPLVISYSENNGKTGSYLMVQYFRNYFVAPGGASMSATSTADSISSTYVCTNNNEIPVAQSNGAAPAPPPYATSAAATTQPPTSPTSTPPPAPSPAPAPPVTTAQPLPAPPTAHPDTLRQSASMGSVSSVATSRSSGIRTRETPPPSYSLSSEWTSGGGCACGGGCATGCSPGCGAARGRGDRFTRPTSLGAGTVSEVSSLTSPGSPPMPTSPTAENEPSNASELTRRLLRQIAALPSRESESWHENVSTLASVATVPARSTAIPPAIPPPCSKLSSAEKSQRHRFWSSSAPATPQTAVIAAVMPGGSTSSMLLREARGVAADLH